MCLGVALASPTCSGWTWCRGDSSDEVGGRGVWDAARTGTAPARRSRAGAAGRPRGPASSRSSAERGACPCGRPWAVAGGGADSRPLCPAGCVTRTLPAGTGAAPGGRADVDPACGGLAVPHTRREPSTSLRRARRAAWRPLRTGRGWHSRLQLLFLRSGFAGKVGVSTETRGAWEDVWGSEHQRGQGGGERAPLVSGKGHRGTGRGPSWAPGERGQVRSRVREGPVSFHSGGIWVSLGSVALRWGCCDSVPQARGHRDRSLVPPEPEAGVRGPGVKEQLLPGPRSLTCRQRVRPASSRGRTCVWSVLTV